MDNPDTITFDLWETLIVDEPGLGHERARLRIEGAMQALASSGRRFSQDALWKAYGQCVDACRRIRAKGKDIGFREQVEVFVGNVDGGLPSHLEESDFDAILASYRDSFFEYPAPVHPRAAEVLALLRARGYRLGLISNTGMTPGTAFRRYMETLGILDYFDALTFSDEVGWAKPSPQIFQITLERLKAAPSTSVHVGDDLTNDVQGATAFGMRAIWVPPSAGSRPNVRPDLVASNLADVPTILLALRQ